MKEINILPIIIKILFRNKAKPLVEGDKCDSE